MSRRRPTPWWLRMGQRGVTLLVSVLGRTAAHLSGPAGARLGAWLGDLAYVLLPGRRRVALANLTKSFGTELPPEACAALARQSFRHLGTTALECCRLFFGEPGGLLSRVRVEGMERAKAALAEGRGVLLLAAHFGNWELLAAASVLTGFPLNVVVRPLDNPFLDRVLARGREQNRVRLIEKRRAVAPVRAALARGECVGILLDQDAGRAGVFVPFFGQAASTSRALAVLALKTGAPVLPVFIRRLAGGEHEVTIEPPVELARTGRLAEDVVLNTARFTAAIERQVRACPEQWFWVHRRWKTRPGQGSPP